MTTTIAVREETRDMLEDVKKELNAGNFDETIRKLIVKMKKPKTSFFGIAKGKIKGEFVREEIDRFA
jgi:predicted CopG family antitoxin